MPEPSDDIIDVVIPLVEKDLDVLPLCVSGIRTCMQNRLGEIYLVAPKSECLIKATQRLHLCFVNEVDVLGYSPSDIHLVTETGYDRSGWIFQQLLKLSGKIGKNRYYLVIDADHVLLNPHTFITSEHKHVLYQSKEYYYPYYENIARLTGRFPYQSLSYIAHKMVFDKEELTMLRKLIEKRNKTLGNSWDKIIINSIDRKYNSAFSEFELYGSFINHCNKIHFPWCQKELRKCKILPTYEDLKEKYGNIYLSITFPDYRKTNE